MEIAVRHQLRSKTPFSKPLRVLYRFTSVLGAIYNRIVFPRRRRSASWRVHFEVGGFGEPGSFDRGVSAGLKPTHSLRQRGDRVAVPGAAITRQGSGRSGRHCLQRYA